MSKTRERLFVTVGTLDTALGDHINICECIEEKK